MPAPIPVHALHLAVLCHDAAFTAPLRTWCADDHLAVYPLTALADDAVRWDERIAAADVVLTEWDPVCAPLYARLSTLVRWRGIPLVAVCDGDDPMQQTYALMSGVDYIDAFPLTPCLLQARVYAFQVRMESTRDQERVRQAAAQHARPTVGGDGAPPSAALEVDDVAGRILANGTPLGLSAREFDLLRYLLAHPDALCSRDQLLRAVWGMDFEPQTNVVDVYIHYLRQKLARHGLTDVIETVRGRGYRLHVPGPTPAATRPSVYTRAWA